MPNAETPAIHRAISASTRLCAVYGHPIAHSASPAMHNPAIEALELDWRYLAFDVHPDQLRSAIDGAKTMRFIGLNLTVPHKLIALNMVDVQDESARRWGAVNTIRFEMRNPGGEWLPMRELPPSTEGEVRSVGFNTDADAIIRSLREDLAVQLSHDASVLLLGAGGAARAAALRLAAEGVVNLFVVNRTMEKAEALAADVRQEFPRCNVQTGYPKERIELLLNATSAGLRTDDPMPFDQAQLDLRNVHTVYDMIYRPAQTAFLNRAKEAGCRIANGMGMLLYQGAKALELWSGKTAPVEIMRQALTRHLYG